MPDLQMQITIIDEPAATQGKVLEFTSKLLRGRFPSFDLARERSFMLCIESAQHVMTLRNVGVREVEPQEGGDEVVFDTNDSTLEISVKGRQDPQQQWEQAQAQRKMTPRKVPRIPGRGHHSRQSWEKRLAWMTEFCGSRFKYLSKINISPESLKGNVENFIGTVQVPVGAAGPLLFKGQQTSGFIVAPFATSEGALVSSVTRGARAVSLAGGVYARVSSQSITRAPVFVVGDIDEAFRLSEWLTDNLDRLRYQVRKVSQYADLVAVSSVQNGNMIHCRFVYRTGDAAGQNMTTIATWQACRWILKQLDGWPEINVEDFFIEGNMSGDKKVTFANMTLGRGVEVTAEALLPDKIVRRMFHVDPDKLLTLYQLGVIGSLQAGMVGANVNVANVVAAIYAATGQDIGCVHESCGAVFNLQRRPGALYASMRLPNLMIGTVGGGTALPTQRECLQMMGCYGKNRMQRLAEIIAGFALALDLSTLSAIASQDFALAHETLGRNKVEVGLRDKHLSSAFFQRVLEREHGGAAGAELLSFDPFELDTSASILMDLNVDRSERKIGHLPYLLRWRRDEQEHETRVVIKSKGTDDELIEVTNMLAQACGGSLAKAFAKHRDELGLRECHVRELEVAEINDERFTRIAPTTYLTVRDDKRQIYLLVMESLEGLSHLNNTDYLEGWTTAHNRAVLRDVAGFHAIYYGWEDHLLELPWLDPPRGSVMVEMSELWRVLLEHNAFEFPEIFNAERVALVRRLIERLPWIWERLERCPRTLVHNDFNLRNIALRLEGEDYRLCAYDWELATLHAPQHDVAEYLAFALPPQAPAEERRAYVDYYREQLATQLGIALEPGPFMEIFDLCCCELMVNRVALYTMAHTFKEYSYLPRVLESLFGYLELLRDEGGGAFGLS